MKILSFLDEKGRSVKSMIATNLAAALHREGKHVLADAALKGEIDTVLSEMRGA